MKYWLIVVFHSPSLIGFIVCRNIYKNSSASAKEHKWNKKICMETLRSENLWIIELLKSNHLLPSHWSKTISWNTQAQYLPASHVFFNFNNNLFLDKDCGHKLTHTNKNEISINLFPVCYESLSIILFCSRLVKSHTPQRFVLRHCLKNWK